MIYFICRADLPPVSSCFAGEYTFSLQRPIHLVTVHFQIIVCDSGTTCGAASSPPSPPTQLFLCVLRKKSNSLSHVSSLFFYSYCTSSFMFSSIYMLLRYGVELLPIFSKTILNGSNFIPRIYNAIYFWSFVFRM